MADDLGYADVSCYGQRDYTTPNIDRLALEGLKFTQGYSNSPDCSSTRTALITGRYQIACRSDWKSQLIRRPPRNWPAAQPPDLAVTAEEGGLWHGAGRQMASRLPAGFQSTQERLRPLLRNIRRRADYFNHGADAPRATVSDARARVPAPRARGAGRAARLHDEPARRSGGADDRGIRQVERAVSAEPAFHGAALAMGGPGRRSRVEADQDIRHRDGGTQTTYATMVQNLDANIGRVLQALDASGLASNTIVVFTSDNGGERFSNTVAVYWHEVRAARRRPSRPGDRALARPYRAGSVSDQAMITMDWMPTLLAAGGTSPDAAYPSDGENLGPRDRPRGAASAQVLLAVQGWIAARYPRRQLEIPADRGERISVRRGSRPARAGQSQGSGAIYFLCCIALALF